MELKTRLRVFLREEGGMVWGLQHNSDTGKENTLRAPISEGQGIFQMRPNCRFESSYKCQVHQQLQRTWGWPWITGTVTAINTPLKNQSHSQKTSKYWKDHSGMMPDRLLHPQQLSTHIPKAATQTAQVVKSSSMFLHTGARTIGPVMCNIGKLLLRFLSTCFTQIMIWKTNIVFNKLHILI